MEYALPSKDSFSKRHVGRDREVKVLPVGVVSAIAMRAVSFVRRRDLEALALIDGEADLAGPAVVVTDAGDANYLAALHQPQLQMRASDDDNTVRWASLNLLPSLDATSLPRGDRSALRCAEEPEVSATWIFPSGERPTAVVGVLQVGIGRIGAMRVVDGAKGRRMDELHVTQDSRDEEDLSTEEWKHHECLHHLSQTGPLFLFQGNLPSDRRSPRQFSLQQAAMAD